MKLSTLVCLLTAMVFPRLVSAAMPAPSPVIYPWEQPAAAWKILARHPWFHPMFTLTTGVSIEQVGQSQTYRPLDLCSYQYKTSDDHTAQFLGGAFLGDELPFLAYSSLLDIGLDYNQTASFAGKGTLIQGADAISANRYQYSYSVRSQQLLVEGKLLGIIQNHFYPYLSLGLGAAFNQTSSYQTTVPAFFEFTPQYSNHHQTNFSYSVGAGIETDLASEWRLGIGYRFTDLGRADLGSGRIDNMPISNTLQQSHLYANQVFAQLTYIPLLTNVVWN